MDVEMVGLKDIFWVVMMVFDRVVAMVVTRAVLKVD